MPRQYPPRVILSCRSCGKAVSTKPYNAAHGKGRYCSRACKAAARRSTLDQSIAPLLWSKADHGDGCWEWNGTVQRKGSYGRIKIGGRYHFAHRVAWEITRGAIPDGMFVCHSCHNPPCIRPDHLFLGTPADNHADMRAKRRIARGEAHGAYTKPDTRLRGEHHPHVRLKEEQVRTIRSRYKRGVHGYKRLADEYGVCISTVVDIIKGRTWAHLGI